MNLLSIYPCTIFKMAVAIFMHASKVVDGKLVKGMLMYPTNFGSFKTEEDRQTFSDLYEGKPPPVPYGGVGKKYGPEKFALKEVRTSVVAHMNKHFSLPKDEDAYWQTDGNMHDNLVFHASVLNGIVHESESSLQAAMRTVWEWTGIRADSKELLVGANVKPLYQPATAESEVSEEVPVQVYHFRVSLDRAKWEWMSHQAEKRTLTDWDVSPYKGVLEELGIPDIIHSAYCKTHGGPRFIASMDDVKDTFTQRLMAEAKVVF